MMNGLVIIMNGSAINVVCHELFCYELVCYGSGLFQMVCYEWSVMNRTRRNQLFISGGGQFS